MQGRRPAAAVAGAGAAHLIFCEFDALEPYLLKLDHSKQELLDRVGAGHHGCPECLVPDIL
jgi:hypothetical protein